MTLIRLKLFSFAILLHFITLVKSAPAGFSISDLPSLPECSQTKCQPGHASLDPVSGSCVCQAWSEAKIVAIKDYLAQFLGPSKPSSLRPRQADPSGFSSSFSASGPETTTFIPPRKTPITPQLIQQSLLAQPQGLATISCVQPFFIDGVIRYCVNVQGFLADTMMMNASTTISAGTIGSGDEPSLIIIPRRVEQSTPQAEIETVTIIAVNMHSPQCPHGGASCSPQYLTYWCQLNNGTIVTLMSDNQVHDIDLINPNYPAFLSITPSPSSGSSKRKRNSAVSDLMTSPAMPKRGLEGINPYTAKMTAASCGAMTCNNNGGSPPTFNPFTAACYCHTPAYIDTNPNAEGVAHTGTARREDNGRGTKRDGL